MQPHPNKEGGCPNEVTPRRGRGRAECVREQTISLWSHAPSGSGKGEVRPRADDFTLVAPRRPNPTVCVSKVKWSARGRTQVCQHKVSLWVYTPSA